MNKEEIIIKILEINKYKKLNPVQELAKEHIGKHTIVCTPTASGKTTVFEIYMLDCLLNKKKKVVYISPLKALTTEHYKETKRKFTKEFNIKVGMSIGDLDESAKYLDNYDVLFLTYEKFDSILRHSPNWIKEVGMVTIDEIHELGGGRGATLEVLITQIKQSYKDINFLGLSATIGNSEELAKWLDAKLVKSNYRPVPLETGVFYNNYIYYEDNKEDLTKLAIKNNNIASVIKDTLNKNKQIIVFCNSRKNTMSFASKYSKVVKEYNKDYNKLRKIAKEAGEVLEQPTQQCINLFNSMSNGVAFHHAGLVSKQRTIVEDGFKEGNIKVIFATPTLAAGINLPAYRVLINSIFRFANGGMVPIPVNEFQQMAGRAGRPKYDTAGQAIAVVNKESDVAKIYNNYIIAGPTNIESQLSKINLLRLHLLSMILINNINTIDELINYFSNTFYYQIFGNTEEIKQDIIRIINEFKEFKFLEGDNNEVKITKLGTKVCYLYIDPLSAYNIINDLEIKGLKDLKDIELIYTILNTTEMYPYLKYKQDKEDELFTIFEKIKQNINFDYEDIYLLSKLYEARMLEAWISEVSEDKLISDFNTTPGQIRDVVSRAEWISHCIEELIKQTNGNIKLIKYFKDMKLRLKYGISDELIVLVRLKNIGRVRARRLFNSGIKGITDIKNNPSKFIQVIGKAGLPALQELKIEYKEIKEKNKLDDFN